MNTARGSSLCCEHNEQKYNIGRALIFAKVTDVHLIAGEGTVQMRKNITDVDQHSCQSSAVLDRLLGGEQVGSSLTSEVLIQPTWLEIIYDIEELPSDTDLE